MGKSAISESLVIGRDPDADCCTSPQVFTLPRPTDAGREWSYSGRPGQQKTERIARQGSGRASLICRMEMCCKLRWCSILYFSAPTRPCRWNITACTRNSAKETIPGKEVRKFGWARRNWFRLCLRRSFACFRRFTTSKARWCARRDH